MQRSQWLIKMFAYHVELAKGQISCPQGARSLYRKAQQKDAC